MEEIKPVLINGTWRPAGADGTFLPKNPLTKEPTGEVYPVSSIKDIEEAVTVAAEAAEQMGSIPPETRAGFLEQFADRIEERGGEIVNMAYLETALPKEPRLNSVELPRTVNQLRQAAAAVRNRSWVIPTIDTRLNIRSMYEPLAGGVAVFGPNNFPLAFNSVSGGDFAAVIAAGNPVIGKANTSHPGTTRLLAEAALMCVEETGMPKGMIQLIYRTDHDVGKKFVSHPLIGATGYTGSRAAGLALKAAADNAGKPIYLELSSINPVFILPGAVIDRLEEIADEFLTSCLMGTGQFCTNPGIIVLLRGKKTDEFIACVKKKFFKAPVGTLLSEGVQSNLFKSISALQKAGAELIVGGKAGNGKGFSCENTLHRVSGSDFLRAPEELQKEAFGNASLFVIADDIEQAKSITRSFEGNLTGTIYSAYNGSDDELYSQITPLLRKKIGRLLNDKMPTGVAVSPAMNHGGPYPATGHPGFTAVGIPASILRFSMLQCYDNVREDRLPPELRDKNPTGDTWRNIDGVWTQEDVK